MAIGDYFGMDAPPDRQIGGEWYTWVSKPGGGGSMVPYSSLSPTEQAKLELGREYGANIYTTGEKGALDPGQASEIYKSYDPALQAALAAIGQNPPSGGFTAPDSPMAPPPVAPPPVAPPPVAPPTPTTPPVNAPAGINAPPPGVETYRNPNDFADWQSAAAQSLRADPNMGAVTGGPAGSYGGGAIWNKVMPQTSDAPMGAMADQRFGAYGAGPSARAPMGGSPTPDSPMAPPQENIDFFTNLGSGLESLSGQSFDTPYGTYTGAQLHSGFTENRDTPLSKWYGNNFWNLQDSLADPNAPVNPTQPGNTYTGGSSGNTQAVKA